ncbi:hypothetical protein [Mesoplasma melaleucae]|uniref:Uncharacterized protein n=1 Tax=Mesoplasma melaleucae TaxID=81459 RepID=A0A2K8NW97_9MOLU|nr:hypothetical protein [Mesoplasma melaleucae]ATZ17826.1 hypothetical protein EMELA_v1c02530 [Mesoplasma melaleucae]
MPLLFMKCLECKEIIELKMNKCALCEWAEHCCPGYITTANAKHCEFYKVAIYLPYILNEKRRIE